MKLGVSSYSYSNYMRQSGANYFDICDKAKKTGFEGIEFIDLNTDIHQAESETALAQAIRAYCEKIGLEVVAYTIHADFMQEGKDPQEEVERVKAKVDVAKVLGLSLIHI